MAETPASGPSAHSDEPLTSRVLGTGARGVSRLAGATGVDHALDSAVEESIVRAMESPAVARALIRLADDGELQDVLERAAAHADLEEVISRAIESDTADRVWAEILASDKAQMLVERVADAPEVRAAIAQQGLGLIGDIGLQVRRLTRPLDRGLERITRALLRKPRREGKTGYAGLVTRTLAAAIDGALLFLGLSLAAGLLASVITAVFGPGDGLSSLGVVLAALVWASVAGLILVWFWALAGQTPGMRFLGIRLDADGERRIGLRAATKRLFALGLALIPLGLGYFAMLGSDRRRGLHDSLAHTTVLYDDPKAPHAIAVDGQGEAPPAATL